MIRLYPPPPHGADEGEGDPQGIYDGLEWPEPPGTRPYVRVNMVATVDGKATLGRGRHPQPIGSHVDRSLMVRLRRYADAVLRGAGTVRQNPYYPRVPPPLEAARLARDLQGQPLACVVSGSGALDPAAPFFARAPRRPVVFLGPEAPAPVVESLRAVAQVEQDREGLDVGRVLARLHRGHGVRALLCEGGPTLNAALLAAGCVDELFVTVAPFVAGSSEELTIVHGPQLLQPFPGLELLSAYLHQDELFLRYRIRPGAG